MISTLQKSKLETRCRPPYSPAPPEDTCSSFQTHLLPLASFYRRHFLDVGCVLQTACRNRGEYWGTQSLWEPPERLSPFSAVTHSSTYPLLDFPSSPVHFNLTGLSGITFQINSRHPNPGLMMCFEETPTMAQFNYGAEEMAGETPWRSMNRERIQVGGHLVSFWPLGPWFWIKSQQTTAHGPQALPSPTCFCTACELRMAFTILNGWGKNQNKNNILWPIKMI